MKKRELSEEKLFLWLRYLLLAVIVVFAYWLNENFIHFSIHKPTCLILIISFFIIISLSDSLMRWLLNLK